MFFMLVKGVEVDIDVGRRTFRVGKFEALHRAFIERGAVFTELSTHRRRYWICNALIEAGEVEYETWRTLVRCEEVGALVQVRAAEFNGYSFVPPALRIVDRLAWDLEGLRDDARAIESSIAGGAIAEHSESDVVRDVEPFEVEHDSDGIPSRDAIRWDLPAPFVSGDRVIYVGSSTDAVAETLGMARPKGDGLVRMCQRGAQYLGAYQAVVEFDSGRYLIDARFLEIVRFATPEFPD